MQVSESQVPARTGNKYRFRQILVKVPEAFPIVIDQSVNSRRTPEVSTSAKRHMDTTRSLATSDKNHGLRRRQKPRAQKNSRRRDCDRKWYLFPCVKRKTIGMQLTLLDSFCFAFMAINFSSHAAA